MAAQTISNPAAIGGKSPEFLIGRDGVRMAGFRHGFDRPKLRRTKAAPTLEAAFLCHQHGDSHNGRVVWETARSAGPKPGLSTRTAPPTRLTAGKRYSNRKLRSPIMANATHQGAIRPQSVPTPYRPTCETLQGVLAELEAAADLVEQLLTHGTDDATLATVKASLGELVSILNGGR